MYVWTYWTSVYLNQRSHQRTHGVAVMFLVHFVELLLHLIICLQNVHEWAQRHVCEQVNECMRLCAGVCWCNMKCSVAKVVRSWCAKFIKRWRAKNVRCWRAKNVRYWRAKVTRRSRKCWAFHVSWKIDAIVPWVARSGSEAVWWRCGYVCMYVCMYACMYVFHRQSLIAWRRDRHR